MEIRTLLAPLLKWWWLILISAILAGVTSYYAMRNEPEYYETRTTLLVGRPFNNPNPDGSQFFLSQQLASTYADIAKREPVRRATMTSLGMDFLPAYSVRVLPQTQLIEISVNDTNPSRAQVVANALANELVQLSPGAQDPDQQELTAFIDGQLSHLGSQIKETQDEILLLQVQLGEITSAREIADTQNQIAALQNKLNTLQTNYTGFLANSQEEATNVLAIIESADLPSIPIDTNKNLVILMSVALGLVLATSAAYLIEYLDDSVKTEEDVKQTVDLPVLTTLVEDESDDAYPAVAMRSPRSNLSELFRHLRTRVLFLSLDKPLGTLLITSASPNEGKSFTAANLAVVMAQAGYKTILVDADLRRPSQHNIFGIGNNVGLTNLILEISFPAEGRRAEAQKLTSNRLDEAIQPILNGNLFILTAGTIPPNPSELLGSKSMSTVIEALSEKFDFIILDSSPCLEVTDTMLLSSIADSVVLVSNVKQTRSKNLIMTVNRLKEVDADVVGIVLNRVARETGSYYSYYHAPSEEETNFTGDESGRWRDVVDRIRKRLRRPVSNSRTEETINIPTSKTAEPASEVSKVEASSDVSDDLTAISGIGPAFASRLSEAGITTYQELAGLSVEQVRDITQVADWQANPDDWIAQAKAVS